MLVRMALKRQSGYRGLGYEGPDIGLILAVSNAEAGIEVDRLLVLDKPTGLDQSLIDLVAGELLGILVGSFHG